MIQYKTFRVGLLDGATEELNRFLRTHTVASIEHQFLSDGSQSVFAFLVGYEEMSTVALPQYDRKEKIDFRKILSDKEFACFSELRAWRAERSRHDNVPPFNLFNNDQALKMMKLPSATKVNLRSIDGFGDAKMERYGEEILKILEKHLPLAPVPPTDAF